MRADQAGQHAIWRWDSSVWIMWSSILTTEASRKRQGVRQKTGDPCKTGKGLVPVRRPFLFGLPWYLWLCALYVFISCGHIGHLAMARMPGILVDEGREEDGPE